MKKAILLLGMTIFTVSILFFRNVDADTVLIKQQVQLDELIKDTEELQKEEPQTIIETQPEETEEQETPADEEEKE